MTDSSNNLSSIALRSIIPLEGKTEPTVKGITSLSHDSVKRHYPLGREAEPAPRGHAPRRRAQHRRRPRSPQSERRLNEKGPPGGKPGGPKRISNPFHRQAEGFHFDEN